jgi:membrane protein implicated in regulation of membrane protease activity
MLITWWHWIALGLVLILLEMAASGGFYIIFFGVAAIAIGSLHTLGAAGPIWFQILLFSILSIGSLALFRSPLMRWLQLDRGAADVDSLAGETAFPLEEIPPGGVGRVELRGTVWTARNLSSRSISRGDRCAVVRVERLTLFIEPEGATK